MSHHFDPSLCVRGKGIGSRLAHPLLLIAGMVVLGTPAASLAAQRLPGHVPAGLMSQSRALGRLDGRTPVSLAITLPLRNTAQLSRVLAGIYDPASPIYGQYLTPVEFASQFGPSDEDYNAVIRMALSKGLQITGTHPNHLVLDVAGASAAVEAAFGVHLLNFQSPGGRVFHAPDTDPAIPDTLAGRVSGVVGLENAYEHETHSRPVPPDLFAAPLQIGTGPGSGLSPGDVKTVYNLNGVPANGSGETLALLELDGYRSTDINAYASFFGLPTVPLQNVLVDGASGGAGANAGEVTLDIELQMALAPDATKIMVYEGPNTSAGVIDTYNRIATDNLAREISTSWGLAETSNSSSALNSENSIFAQMAAQGQSIFAAAGDKGAYDNGSTITVDDPASQPNVTGVGGTHLNVGAGEAYSSESTWNVNGTINGGAGGGGISTYWSIPTYQQGVISAPSRGSTTYRNVPDVSLNADQYTGYSIYYNGSWTIYGGTSCAAPLWSAFAALVNQQRLASGSAALGFANPALYNVGGGARYSADFHDIADGSTNLYYPAVAGFDDATGWGSFNGANLLNDLAPTGPVTVPAAPVTLKATAGNASVALSWTSSAGAASYSVYRGVSAGGENPTPIASGVSGSSYTDSTAANGVTYYYTVAAVNSAGTSSHSPEASATPAAPALAITGGPTVASGRTTATIKWNTNAAANSVVSYGPSAANLTLSASSASLVTGHSIGLGSLARRTTYYYKVTSSAGGVSVSSAVYSFKTS